MSLSYYWTGELLGKLLTPAVIYCYPMTITSLYKQYILHNIGKTVIIPESVVCTLTSISIL